MDERINRQNSVVNRIIDGTITIDSIDEFKNLLEAFPNNSRLHRVFADLLKKKKAMNAPAAYHKAADLFLKEGLPLQAITSKILEWRIDKPSDEEKMIFFSVLGACNPQSIPSQEFFPKLESAELLDLMARMELYSCAPNTRVIEFGDEETILFFIVSGVLEKSLFHRPALQSQAQKTSPENLMESDIFGDIYPFETVLLSEAEISSLSPVELLTISRADLFALCSRCPNLGKWVQVLFSSRMKTKQGTPLKTIRKTARHPLPTQVSLKIFQKDGSRQPLTLNGFTEDVSLGGACVVLGLNYQTGDPALLTGAPVKIQMGLPIESIKLNILGDIVWGKEILSEGRKMSVVGIKFKEINPIDRGLLEEYCLGSEAEQNLIWSLWSTLIKSEA
ncbi:MAG: PilZ domain-containing protein [Thermodesulfobacteriota bacterium]